MILAQSLLGDCHQAAGLGWSLPRGLDQGSGSASETAPSHTCRPKAVVPHRTILSRGMPVAGQPAAPGASDPREKQSYRKPSTSYDPISSVLFYSLDVRF